MTTGVPAASPDTSMGQVERIMIEEHQRFIPIIGQGGILTAEDALQFIIAGATTVGVGTSLFYDPLVCARINAGVADYLATNGMHSVAELVGTLDAPRKVVEACTC